MVTVVKKLTGGAYPFYEYACLSTDIKPVSLVPDNSICHEIDTGKHFYCVNGAWHELPPRGGSEGGSGGGAEKFVVTLTADDSGAETVWTADKTIAEIVEAHEADQIVVAHVPSEVEVELPLKIGEDLGEILLVSFSGCVSGDGLSADVAAVVGTNGGSGDSWSVLAYQIPGIPAGWKAGVPSYDSNDIGKTLLVVEESGNTTLDWVDNKENYWVTGSFDMSTMTVSNLDKTYSEIKAAALGGKHVLMKLVGEDLDHNDHYVFGECVEATDAQDEPVVFGTFVWTNLGSGFELLYYRLVVAYNEGLTLTVKKVTTSDLQ